MAVRAFWVDVDGEGEPTVWTGQPESPRAVLRRCDISGDDAVRDAVLSRLDDPEPTPWATTWRCIANACSPTHHPYSGWEDGRRQVKAHARAVAHDRRWPLTIAHHDATGRQFSVSYEEPVAALTGRVEHAVDCVEGIDPDAKWYCGRGPCGLMDGHEGDCA